jgi:MFS family permease
MLAFRRTAAGTTASACCSTRSTSPRAGAAARSAACSATGASSPLQDIYTAELVDDHDLGLLLGVQQALYGVAGAAGPILVGVALAVTGSWVPAIVLTTLGFAGAAFMLRGGDASSSGRYEAALIAPSGGLACCAPSAPASSATASGTRR